MKSILFPATFFLLLSAAEGFSFPAFRLPRPFKPKVSERPPNEVLEICWGDKKLSIAPRRLPTLIEYFRVCTNAVYVLSPAEEPLMLSILRNKIYNALPDVNKAYLYSVVSYDEVRGLEYALSNVENLMTEKGIPLAESKDARWLKIHTNATRAPDAPEPNPCKDLVVLDGVDKVTNQSIKFIPTPYQDDLVKPQYMAIPFSKHFLYEINSRDSVGVLRRYYTLSEQCLATFSAKDVARFKENLYEVILAKFLPVVKENPHRIIPAYGGILAILTDLMECLGNSTSEADSGLATNIQFKPVVSSRNKKVKGKSPSGPGCVEGETWDWSDTPDTETNKFYSMLLIILASVCFLNCLCYLSTFVFYCHVRREKAKKRCHGKSCTSWGHPVGRGMSAHSDQCGGGREVGNHSNKTRCQGREPGIHGNEKRKALSTCDVRGACKDELGMCQDVTHTAVAIEHVKCPHNVISPRPGTIPYSGGKFTRPVAIEHVKCPHNVISPRPGTIPYSGGKFTRPGEFSLVKPLGNPNSVFQTQLYHCMHKYNMTKEDEEGAQSIQGSEEFQRIMRELDEVHRSIQHVLPKTEYDKNLAEIRNANEHTGRDFDHGRAETASENQPTKGPPKHSARPSST
ncbi:hypothetical protein M8J75_013673 [Diaphorina citri]|nr:hypothetical protein M8J75_013673 [Diaphorina citri]